MSQTKVAIGFDQASIERFARMLGHHPQVVGAHCSDDEDDDSEEKSFIGTIASGAHCADDEEDEGEEKSVFNGGLALGAHCSDDDDSDDDDCEKSSRFDPINACAGSLG